MKHEMLWAVGLVALLSVVQEAEVAKVSKDLQKLPSYLIPCSRSDPNLNECAMKNGQAAIPSFIDGDRKYKLPSLNPLEITQLIVSQGTKQVGLTIELSKCKLYGLKDAIIKNINIDLPNKKISWRLFTPRVDVIGHYNISGRILLLPLHGHGDTTNALFKPNFEYTWTFKTEMRNGEEYMVPQEGTMTFDLEGVNVKLENLFGGDNVLGPQMNKFLNENWREAIGELGPSVGQALSKVFHSILTTICQTVPYKNIFTP